MILPLKVGGTFQYMGASVTAADAIIVEPSQVVDFLVGGDLVCATIYLKGSEFRRHPGLGLGPAFETRSPRAPSLFSNPGVVALKREVSAILHEDAAGDVFEVPPGKLKKAAARILSQLTKGLLRQSDSSGGVHAREGDHRQMHARRARDAMEANRQKPLKLAALGSQLGVSIRTLQYAFQALYGIGPAKYDTLQRLSGAYIELRRSDPSETSVTEVATNWGFYHFGRFSQVYRHQFGEKPSSTLAIRPVRFFPRSPFATYRQSGLQANKGGARKGQSGPRRNSELIDA